MRDTTDEKFVMNVIKEVIWDTSASYKFVDWPNTCSNDWGIRQYSRRFNDGRNNFR
jgi:hypothetical protein